MQRAVLTMVLWLLVARSACAAQNNDTDAKAFLEKIVASDFSGDASSRIGHVLQSQRSSGRPVVSEGPAFEAYDLDSDPLVVVNDWQLVGIERGAESNICGKFHFTVVATTVGKGLPSWMSEKARRIQVLATARSEVIEYCAKFYHGVWMLIDAPVPRVGKEALIAFMQERSARAAKIASEIDGADPRAMTNARRISSSLNEQLTVLLSLMHGNM